MNAISSAHTLDVSFRRYGAAEDRRLSVMREWAGKGIAHALHDMLLSARPEQRATLLVRVDLVSGQKPLERLDELHRNILVEQQSHPPSTHAGTLTR